MDDNTQTLNRTQLCAGTQTNTVCKVVSGIKGQKIPTKETIIIIMKGSMPEGGLSSRNWWCSFEGGGWG